MKMYYGWGLNTILFTNKDDITLPRNNMMSVGLSTESERNIIQIERLFLVPPQVRVRTLLLISCVM